MPSVDTYPNYFMLAIIFAATKITNICSTQKDFLNRLLQIKAKLETIHATNLVHFFEIE